MNAVIPAQFGAVSARFQGMAVENELGAGIQSGFGIIGYKGKVWSIRKGGEEKNLMRDDGDGPRNSIEVVVLKAAGVVSKIFYANGYVEGSTAAPDCYSTNGVTPAAGAAKKQSIACATCPINAWGSRITSAGKQGKACSDNKRLAVAPLNDIPNEVYGGPMLLRVPAASLTELATFGSKMSSLGYPYYAFGTRIAFDANESYPKFVFSAIRPLSDQEADLVIRMRESPEVARILAEDEHAAPALAPPRQAASAFEQPGPGPAAARQEQQALPNASVTGHTNVVPMPRPTTGGASTPSAPTAAMTTATPRTTTTSAPATAQSPAVAAPMAQPAGGAPPVSSTTTSPSDAAAMAPTGVQNFDDALDALLA
jgi:hypothetical protein